jgi:hypothetical protein
MKKFWMVLLVTLALCSTQVNAAAGDRVCTDGLTEEQQAQIQLDVAKMKNQNPLSPELVTEWAGAGTAIGAALGGCAKEIGVQVNDFANTPVGVVAVFIIAWKLVGADLVQLLVGLIWLFVGIHIWRKYFMQWIKVRSIEYNEKGKITNIVYTNQSNYEGACILMGLFLLIIIGIACAIIFP